MFLSPRLFRESVESPENKSSISHHIVLPSQPSFFLMEKRKTSFIMVIVCQLFIQ